MIITISGYGGTGKSSIARKIAETLGYSYFSAGQMFREFAEEAGIPLVTFAASAPQEVDDLIAEAIVQACKNGRTVIDGRRGAFLCPESVKIWLKCSDEEAARRISERETPPTIEAVELEKISRELKVRNQGARNRILHSSGVDLENLSIYDLVIDTGKITSEIAVSLVLCYVRDLDNTLDASHDAKIG